MVIRKRTLGVLLASFIVLWLNSGNFDYVSDRIPMVAKFGVVALWFLIACTSDRGFLNRYIRISFPIFVALLLLIVSSFLGRTTYYEAYFMRFMYLAIIQALFSYYFYGEPKRDVGFLLLVLLVDVSIVTIHTFIIVLQNPIVARAISTSLEMRTELIQNFIPDGVGGYGLCYQLAFIIPCVGYIFNERHHNTMVKILIYAAIVLSLFQFQITMALLLSVVFIFYFEIIRSNDGKWSIVFVKITALITLVLVALNFETVIGFITQYANDDLADRLNELLSIRSPSVNDATDLLSRYQLYSKSISSFFSNPVWGKFGNGPFGAHSTFLDLLASFGLLGLFGICGICRPLTILCKAFDKGSTERLYVIWITIVFVFFSILNVSLWSDILLVCNLAIPLLFKVSSESLNRV